jgi:hypothetical protein
MKSPARWGAGRVENYRLISTSTPERGVIVFSFNLTPGSRRFSIVTSLPLPTVAPGSCTQLVVQEGPTQFLSHISAAPAAPKMAADPASPAARVNT